ncbi:WD40-repeat-containing domain protein, partial [Phlyctochytrium arcticum]
MSSLDAVTTLSVVQDSLFIGTKSGAVVEWDVDNQTVIRTYQPTPEDEALLEGEESSESKSTECAAVTALTCSSRKIISGSADGALRVWSVATGACARSLLAAQKGAVTALTHTPEGRLYSAGADGIINEWDARSLRKKWMLNGHSGAVTMLYAGPSGSGRLFSAGSDHTIRVWDLNTGRCLVTYQEHNDAVLSLCLGRDLLYSGAQDGAIHVMDVNTGQCLRVLRGHAGAVRSLCLAKGKLYSCGDDGHVIAWD